MAGRLVDMLPAFTLQSGFYTLIDKDHRLPAILLHGFDGGKELHVDVTSYTRHFAEEPFGGQKGILHWSFIFVVKYKPESC